MDEPNYPSNSNFPKQRIFTGAKAEEKPPEKKVIEKIVTGKVITRKTPLGKRLLRTLFAGDGRGVWGYLLIDVLIPAAKDTIADMASQGVERAIYGDARSSSRRTGQRPGQGRYVDYGQRYAGRRDEPRTMSRRNRANFDFREVILSTRLEAEEIIDKLFDTLQRYELVTVSDFYGMLGITPAITDEKWGWTDLRGASVQRVSNGYLLDLPQPDHID